MKKITIYELMPRNYKKSGGLKKTASPALALTLSDDEDHDTRYIVDRICSVFSGMVTYHSPYVFTHIRMDVINSGETKHYAIYEHVVLPNGDELITSPISLLKELQNI